MNPAKISEQQKNKIELLMFKMFICCALPWVLLNSEFFVAFVLALAPTFHIPDRSVFFPKHLAQETANWSRNFQDFLANKTHLTLSLDGWSTRANDEIYTFHTTTPKRRSFFTDGEVFKGISITGDALKAVAIKVIIILQLYRLSLINRSKLLTSYGAKKYSAIVGDGGANVRSAKVKICKEYPWIINIYDPCHNLNLFLKDLGKLFRDVSDRRLMLNLDV